MFTLEDIQAAHAKVKSGADFPSYVQDLIGLGVKRYDVYVHDGHSEYSGMDDFIRTSEPKYDLLTVAPDSNPAQFGEHLQTHQRGETDYFQFSQDAANAGVEKWTVDTDAMTCTYYDTAGKVMLEEEIPKI